jgi:hypothetical protein
MNDASIGLVLGTIVGAVLGIGLHVGVFLGRRQHHPSTCPVCRHWQDDL